MPRSMNRWKKGKAGFDLSNFINIPQAIHMFTSCGWITLKSSDSFKLRSGAVPYVSECRSASLEEVLGAYRDRGDRSARSSHPSCHVLHGNER